jgi:hypothetical protein
MSAAHRRPDEPRPEDAETEGRHAAPEVGATVPEEGSPSPGTPSDWQVLLLRYLPQPASATHVIKRLAPR